MADIRPPEPVKLIVGMLSVWTEAMAAAAAALAEQYGPVDLRSDVMSHDFTDYYRADMGHPLLRRFIAMDRLIDPGDLPAVKRRTNDLERSLAASGRWPAVRRPVNLDPGYLTPAKLVLASCKDYTHRIYLRDGVYAETTLGFTRGGWQCYEWTYPDFRTPQYQAFLTRVRERFMAQRKESRRP